MEVKQRKSSKKGEVVPDAAEEEAKGEEEPTGFDVVEVTGDLDDRLSQNKRNGSLTGAGQRLEWEVQRQSSNCRQLLGSLGQEGAEKCGGCWRVTLGRWILPSFFFQQ